MSSSTAAAIPRRSAVVPQDPMAGNSWGASPAPNWSEMQEPRMNSTGTAGSDELLPGARDGAVEAGEEVVTPLLCPLPSVQVQRMFSICIVKQAFMIERGSHAQPPPPLPAARAAAARDDDRDRARPLDVPVGRLPAALPARARDARDPVRAGGAPGGAHRCGHAARTQGGGDAGARRAGAGRARGTRRSPRGGERAPARRLL